MQSSSDLVYRAFGDVELAQAEATLAKYWGWVLGAGAVALIGGIAALCCPTMATAVVLLLSACVLLAVGIVNMTGICFAEDGLKGPSFVLGLVQAVFALILNYYPLQSLVVITILIAIMFMLDGVYKCGLSHKNRDMPGMQSVMVNGICEILFSIIIISAMPTSSTYTLGILIGVNMVTVGFARLYLGWLGWNLDKNGRSITAPAGTRDTSEPIV